MPFGRQKIRVVIFSRLKACKITFLKYILLETKLIFFISSMCLQWFISNYTMHVASLKSKFSNQAVFSASAATFVMTLSAMFPVRACDKFTFTKFIIVLVSVCSLVSAYFYECRLRTNF